MMKAALQQSTEAQHYRAQFDKAQHILETVCRESAQTGLCRKKAHRKKIIHPL
jgi:hypothetical protein